MSNDVVELALPEESRRSLFLVYLRIVFAPVLVFLFFLAGYLGHISLRVETHSVIMLGILLFIALIFARHSAEYGCCVFEKKTSVFKAGLKDYIMGHLMAVGNRKKSNAPFDAFAENFTTNVRNDNYASVAAGVFPMLGILGTFISIAIAMPEFSSTNIDALEGEIAQLLGGVGTAFYVSIYGIFLALWWIYFEKKGLSRFERIIYRYKNATKNFFWDKDEISQSLMQEILSRNEKVANAFESLLDSDFSEKLKLSMAKNRDAFNEMVDVQKNIVNITSDKLKNTRAFLSEIEEVSYKLNKRNEKTISDIDIILKDTNLAYSNLTSQLDKFISQSQANNVKFIGSIERLVNEINSFKKTMDDSFKPVQSFESGINHNADGIKKILLDIKEKYSDDSSFIDELQNSLSNIDRKRKK